MNRTPLESWICEKIDAPGPALDRAGLETYQLERLDATLALASEKSPFYRRRLDGCRLPLASLDEIAALPFTTAYDLRRLGTGMVCVSQSEIERIVTLDTSGTTGDPKRLYFTRSDQELTADFFQHGMSTFTEAGDSVMVLLPYERPGSVGDLLAMSLRRLEAHPVLYGPVRAPRLALQVMRTEKANVLVGAPTHVLALARFDALEAARRTWKPMHVLLSTDHVPEAIVSALQAIWGCAVYNHYGMTETGLGGGVDCQARRGYHLREADLYYEIVDPHTGRALPDGRSGEIVVTTLTRSGMPLIRYRTGDIGCVLPGVCPCGTTLKTLAHVRGRHSGLAQLMEDSQGWLSMADLDDALFPIEAVLNFSATLTGGPRHASLNLEFVLLPGAGTSWQRQADMALDEIPAVRGARQSGCLEVFIRGRVYDPATAGSLAKRKIIDQRSDNYA